MPRGVYPHKPKPVASRFWARVEKKGKDECWLWTAGTIKGYGTMSVDGKREYAHRVSWTLHRGTILDGLQVLHKCDNPPCVNPDHLFLGTQLDNIQDMANKGRFWFARQTACKHGHQFNKQNTLYSQGGRRTCRICRRARIKAFKERRKELSK